MYKEDPISNVKWIEVEKLNANDYNPNVVLNKELKLLELSVLKNGWIQPILINKDNTIIDGFHRSYLSRNSKLLKEKYNGKVPCVVMDLTEAERMLLTIRINRAKGNHVAFKMHEIVKSLIDKHEVSMEYIQESIGASKDEIKLLYKDGVFDALNIKEHKYSRAWKSPKTK
ncbi:ParB N-terminal domain-containing protein [Akkermansiaceae bacterium]|nr:ParB N-terminal domain-containing protein [Akkermansiaceae bacterium]